MSGSDRGGLNRWGVAALASAGFAAAGAGIWALERNVVKRLRRGEDPDQGADFAIHEDERLVARTPDGAELAVYARGHHDAPTIVFVHGWTLAARVWTKQFADLPDRGFRVVAYDQRGHGASTSGHEGFSDETLGLDLATVLESLDLRDVVVVGHSMGGLAVQAFCSWHPEVAAERVRGVVLLSTLARTMIGDPFGGLIEQVAARVPDMTWVMARPDLGFLLSRAGFGRDALPSHIEFTRRLTTECATTTRRDAGRMLLDIDLTERLADIDLPALVVVGSADLLTPVKGAELIHEGLPKSRLEIVEGAGHMIMLERPREFEEMIAEFAAEVGVGRPGAAATEGVRS